MNPLFNMLPCLASRHGGNGVDRHAIILGDLGQGFSLRSTPADFANRWLIKARQIMPLSNPIGAITYRQKLIFGSRCPLQIIQSVVSFVSVLVVHLRKIVGVLEERHRDDAMNERLPCQSLGTKEKLFVSALAAERDEKRCARFAVHSPCATPRAHLENMCKVGAINWFPNLFHSMALPKSGIVVNEASNS